MGMFRSLVAKVIQKALLAESHYGLPSSYRPPSFVVNAGSQETFRNIFAQVWLGRPIVGRGWLGGVGCLGAGEWSRFDSGVELGGGATPRSATSPLPACH